MKIQIFPLDGGKLVLDSSCLQEGIFVYTLVKLYNKTNLIYLSRAIKDQNV